VLDSIGTGVPRDFVSAGPRGSAGTRGSAGPGLASAAAAGGVAVGLDAAPTDATGCVFGADTSCAGIHIQRAAAIAITPPPSAAMVTDRNGEVAGTGAGDNSRRTSTGGPLRCSAAFFSASRM
jgi:hypothetical protein